VKEDVSPSLENSWASTQGGNRPWQNFENALGEAGEKGWGSDDKSWHPMLQCYHA
jgi:hypothetical protein